MPTKRKKPKTPFFSKKMAWLQKRAESMSKSPVRRDAGAFLRFTNGRCFWDVLTALRSSDIHGTQPVWSDVREDLSTKAKYTLPIRAWALSDDGDHGWPLAATAPSLNRESAAELLKAARNADYSHYIEHIIFALETIMHIEGWDQ